MSASEKAIALKDLVLEALDDLRGNDIKVVDVSEQTNVTDFMVIASGTSNRHVKSLANNVIAEAGQAGDKPYGVEGMDTGEWVLIDLLDVVVHVMLPATREFYEIERLWSLSSQSREARVEEADGNASRN
ncbi:MAG: ribosome silencing factor [Pseudomonadales bacterium]|nr:ribosome silencing factor [Pseudomonadales bacterium]